MYYGKMGRQLFRLTPKVGADVIPITTNVIQPSKVNRWMERGERLYLTDRFPAALRPTPMPVST
jgi:hypothetical protein